MRWGSLGLRFWGKPDLGSERFAGSRFMSLGFE